MSLFNFKIEPDLSYKKIKFVNKSPNPDPTYAHEGDSGFDLRAWITEEESTIRNENNEYGIVLKPLERRLIHTGIYFELPKQTEVQVRPRSGCALKQGLSVVNTPGTVDSFYRNEVGIIAINLSNADINIYNGDRIAQAVLCPVYVKELTILEKVDEISKDTERGLKRFGSSGMK